MTQSVIKLTFDEYLRYNDGTDKRYEYEDGELIEMAPGTGLHEDIISFLVFELQTEVRRLKMPLRVHSSGIEIRTVHKGKPQSRKPDVSVITVEQNLSIRNTTAILYTAPPLVIEVVSPESVKRDYGRKLLEYAECGISEYWIVDPLKDIVSVLQLTNGTYEERQFTGADKVESGLFPEIVLTVSKILAGEIY